MRKGTLFLSAALTAFVMTMLAGVLYTYKGLAITDLFQPVQPTAAPVQSVQDVASPVTSSIPTQFVVVSPQDAASIAAKSLKQTDVYSVQLSQINALNLYKVTFTSGNVVYVSMDGQVILSVPAPQPTPAMVTVSAPGSPPPHKSGGGHSGGGGEHEGGD